MRNPNHVENNSFSKCTRKKFFLDLSNQFFRLEVVSFSVVRKEETIPENIKFIFPLAFRAHVVISTGARNEIIFLDNFMFSICAL